VAMLYWYPQLSKINVSLDISSTKCKPIHLAICKYHVMCDRIKFSYKKDHLSTKCKQHLSQITKWTNVSLGTKQTSWGPFITYAMEDCFTLQIFQDDTSLSNWTKDQCRIGITPASDQDPNSHYNQYFKFLANIKGLLEPLKVGRFCHEYKRFCKEGRHYPSYVQFEGKVNRICYKMSNDTVFCEKDKYVAFRESEIYLTGNKRRNVIASADYSTYNINQLKIHVFFREAIFESSWIDITIHKRNLIVRKYKKLSDYKPSGYLHLEYIGVSHSFLVFERSVN